MARPLRRVRRLVRRAAVATFVLPSALLADVVCWSLAGRWQGAWRLSWPLTVVFSTVSLLGTAGMVGSWLSRPFGASSSAPLSAPALVCPAGPPGNYSEVANGSSGNLSSPECSGGNITVPTVTSDGEGALPLLTMEIAIHDSAASAIWNGLRALVALGMCGAVLLRRAVEVFIVHPWLGPACAIGLGAWSIVTVDF